MKSTNFLCVLSLFSTIVSCQLLHCDDTGFRIPQVLKQRDLRPGAQDPYDFLFDSQNNADGPWVRSSNSYRIASWTICKYKEACNSQTIFGKRGSLLADSCDVSYALSQLCQLERIECFAFDKCTYERVCMTRRLENIQQSTSSMSTLGKDPLCDGFQKSPPTMTTEMAETDFGAAWCTSYKLNWMRNSTIKFWRKLRKGKLTKK